MTDPDRWQCTQCRWIGHGRALLSAPNPFEPEYRLYGCPRCKDALGFDPICDEAGCMLVASCGFLTDDGYRRTCYKHYGPK